VGRKRFKVRLMGKVLVFCVLLMPLFLPTAAWAQKAVQIEEVVVTASKIAETKDEATSSIVVITSKEIEKSNVEFVADLFRKTTELNIVQAGGMGATAAVYLRGASPDETLIMIDGVKVKSTNTGEFDFSGINIDDIERIEVVKGPQSTIYGSEAMGGVINIITKKGKGKITADISYEHGSYNTSNPAITLSGGNESFDYRLNVSYYRTDGISAVKGGPESDGYENTSFSSKLGFRAGEKMEVQLSGKYNEFLSELDARGEDDINREKKGSNYLSSLKGTVYVVDSWEQILTVSRVGESWKIRDPDDPDKDYDIASKMDSADWQNTYYNSDAYTTTAGVEYRVESGEQKDVYDKSVENKAVYLNNKLKGSNITFNAGLRYDDHQTFGSATTYRIGAVEDVKQANMRFRASYGTGFKAPSLYDLYYKGAMGSGNIDLKPEKSTSWEVGVDQDYSRSFSLYLTYFEQDYDDRIEWVSSDGDYSPQNIEDAEVKGVETGFTFRFASPLSISTAYTNLESEDKFTGKRLSLVPKDKVNVALEYSMLRLSLRADYIYVGERYDITARGDLDAYELVNMSGSFNVTKSIGLFGRIENLLDEDYAEDGSYNFSKKETYYFGTPGKSFYGGIKATF
jgi:vitamin B12 transporter